MTGSFFTDKIVTYYISGITENERDGTFTFIFLMFLKRMRVMRLLQREEITVIKVAFLKHLVCSLGNF